MLRFTASKAVESLQENHYNYEQVVSSEILGRLVVRL